MDTVVCIAVSLYVSLEGPVTRTVDVNVLPGVYIDKRKLCRRDRMIGES